MPSRAHAKYLAGRARAAELRAAVNDPRLRPITRDRARVFAHASLAAHVAAWDAFLNELMNDFFAATANPAVGPFDSMHSIGVAHAARLAERFNTPNWENSRNLLLSATGYDPMPDWVWPARKMNVQQVKERLNEILRVRHSFAHGFPVPSYTWNRTKGGRVRLTVGVLRDVERFFNNLVQRTSAGLAAHVQARYGVSPNW